jgi:hypothetical protein
MTEELEAPAVEREANAFASELELPGPLVSRWTDVTDPTWNMLAHWPPPPVSR